MAGMAWRIGIDIGGTFTDVALVEDTSGSVGVAKVPTTPDDLASGPWLVTRVEHKLQRGAGETRFWAETTAGSSLLDSLLGAALGAVGGLL